MQDILYQTFRWVGILAPLFLFLATLVVLYGKTTLTAFFVVGAALNVALNFALKYGFQEARPGQEEQLRIDLAAGKTIALDRYGMPSGHAQEMSFNVVFLALAYYNSLLKKEYYTLATAIDSAAAGATTATRLQTLVRDAAVR